MVPRLAAEDLPMSKHTLVWRVAAVLALPLVVPGTAVAQRGMMDPGGGRHLIRIGFGGGATVPTKEAGDVFENGVNGQAFVLVTPPGFPTLRFNLGYQKFDLKEALQAGAATGQSTMLSGVAGLSINLFNAGPIRPYVTAGVGAFNLTDKVTTGAGSASESSLRFGVDGGGGLALRLGRLEAFIEGRLQNVYTSEKGLIDTKTIQAVPITFGIIF
jgi:hypothetical protein